MFESLTSRLKRTVDGLRGRGRLTEDNIKETLREVRLALLEADVALPVVRDFIASIRERALGQEVTRSLSPGQELVRIVQEELIALMGEANEGLNLSAQPPVVIMV
ncbi:MAG: signal recognition particle receptor subunit alpha, partial [Anaerolineae bacterium]|nr:signal recognition particle receptor subunit alpha [Anaerolineae bacterium]